MARAYDPGKVLASPSPRHHRHAARWLVICAAIDFASRPIWLRRPLATTLNPQK